MLRRSGCITVRVQYILEKNYNFEIGVILSDLYPSKHACDRTLLLKDPHYKKSYQTLLTPPKFRVT